jgi:hypothetical protein
LCHQKYKWQVGWIEEKADDFGGGGGIGRLFFRAQNRSN